MDGRAARETATATRGAVRRAAVAGLATLAVVVAAALLGVPSLAPSASAAPPAAKPAPTYHGRVGRIFAKHCNECHHAGDIAPMALDDPEMAARWAESIVEEVEAGRMPPWKPTRGIGRFVGERGVSAREIETLRRWSEAGAPLGTPPRRPKKIDYPSGWRLGDPDAVLEYGEGFLVPAGGEEIYRCFPIANPFGRDVWISGIDVQPGDRRVVHHVVLFVDLTGASAELDAADPAPGYECFGGPGFDTPFVLGGWAPGNRTAFSPRGTALRLRAGDTVVMQCHYSPAESDVTDRTRVGLFLSPDLSPEEIFLVPVLNRSFTLPAGDPAVRVEASFESTGISGRILSVIPHMHLLGKRIEVDLLLPDETEQRLVEIADWDFHWQDTYTFARPLPAPTGSGFRVRAVYDNTAANPRNPNSPPVDVSYGERTTDEMCLAFVAVTLGLSPAAPPPPRVRSVAVDRAGRLVVAARGLGRGGRIEIAATGEGAEPPAPVADSKPAGAGRLRSAADWTALVPEGEDVEIRVRRRDGRLSPPFVFRR
jgi:mono/diheme cytochrome c family protein